MRVFVFLACAGGARTDPELLRRRAAGESLRGIAADYGVAHTTLHRYFQRPEVARQLRQAARVVAAGQGA